MRSGQLTLFTPFHFPFHTGTNRLVKDLRQTVKRVNSKIHSVVRSKTKISEFSISKDIEICLRISPNSLSTRDSLFLQSVSRINSPVQGENRGNCPRRCGLRHFPDPLQTCGTCWHTCGTLRSQMIRPYRQFASGQSRKRAVALE